METPETTTSLAVLVPVYNEQYLVETSLSRLSVLADQPLLERVQVIVVDDGSSDRTPEVLERLREKAEGGQLGGEAFHWVFVRHPENRGKGAAIRTALEHVDTELVVIHDADLEYQPRDLLRMIPLFVRERADAVFGSRFLSGDFRRVLFFRHSLGNKLITLACNLVSDLNLTDIETCYKMMRAELLKSIPLESSDFRIEPELTIKLSKRDARVFEVPISYSGRTYAEGKKIGWRDGFKAFWAIAKFAISDNIYTRDTYGSEILARLSRAPRFTRWMADVIRPHVGERVLEIGAGIGNLTVHLVPRTIYCTSDINPLYLWRLERLQETRPYLRSVMTDVTERDTFPDEERFDTAICLNVIEHVEDDAGALRNIGSVLKPDGTAIILVPRGPGLYGSLDEVLGHCRRYTRESLAALGEKAGFRLQRMLEFNRGSVPGWWLSGRVLRRRTFSLFQIKLLNLLVPLFRLLDRVEVLPSLSLIAIFEKMPADAPAAEAERAPVATAGAPSEGASGEEAPLQDASAKGLSPEPKS